MGLSGARCDVGLICWGDLSPMDREDPLMVEDVRNGPLSMILKDG